MNSTHANFVKTSLGKIYQASISNRLAFFVGAGVSANSGLPTWSELIERFATELYGTNRIDNKSLTIEEYLKIPQYYCSLRGNKEYWDIINSIFEKQAIPNIIHKAIFDLNPYCIITTNFDCLLEEAAVRLQKLYHTVTDNSDLPFSTKERHIIKMHGDLKRRNIVLKETDFLNYSTNFSLIEIFIKSIFSHKLVVFLGYNAADPDFKLMYQSVKEVLGGDFQPAYLINTKDDFNELEYIYNKDRGIHLLYTKELYPDSLFKETSHDETELTEEKVKLHPVLTDTSELDEEFLPVDKKNILALRLWAVSTDILKKNLIEELYEKLLPLDIFCYLPHKVLIKLLNEHLHNGFTSYNNGILIQNKSIIRSLNTIKKVSIWRDKELRRKARFILEQFTKAGITKIVDHEGIIKISVKKRQMELNAKKQKMPRNRWHFYEDKLLSFQWYEIERSIFDYEMEGKVYRQAAPELLTYSYLCSTIGLPDKAQVALKSYINTTKNVNVANYLVRFNLKTTSFSVQNAFFRNTNKNHERRFEKYPDFFDPIIDLNSIVDILSPSEQKSIHHIDKFEYPTRLLNDAYEYWEELEGAYAKIEYQFTIGGSVSSNAKRDLYDLFNYCFYNGIHVDIYQDVEAIFIVLTKCILLSHVLYQKTASNLDRRVHRGNNYERTIDELTFYCIVTNYAPEKLRSYLNSLQIPHIILATELKDTVVDSFANLVQSSNNDNLVTSFLRYSTNYIMVLSYCELEASEVNRILREVLNMKKTIWATPFQKDFIEALNIFISRAINAKQELDVLLLEDILWLFNPLEDTSWTQTKKLTESLCVFMKSKEVVITDTEPIQERIKYVEDKSNKGVNHEKLRLYNRWLYHLYPLLPLGYREQISVDVKTIISTIIHSDMEQSLGSSVMRDFILSAFKLDLLHIHHPIINTLLQYIEFLKKQDATASNSRMERKAEELEYILLGLGVLIHEHKIAAKYVRKIKKEHYGLGSFLDYILDPDSFDYNYFDVSWLQIASETQLLQMKKNKKIKAIIRAKLLSELYNKSVSKDYVRNFLEKHFL